MKIIIISPLDNHHKYIISEIYKKHKNIIVAKDSKRIKAKFDTRYKNEYLQNNFENKIWFKKNFVFPKDIKVLKLFDINNKININKIVKLKPFLIITSGAIKLNNNFINEFKKTKIVNLHGGDPEFYRGLDSLFWAIYHNEYHNLKVAIHYVDKKKNKVNIIEKQKNKIIKKMSHYQLRKSNVELTIKLLLRFLKKILNKKKILTIRNKKGKYYSFMPSVLKDIVEKKFNNFTKNL